MTVDDAELKRLCNFHHSRHIKCGTIKKSCLRLLDERDALKEEIESTDGSGKYWRAKYMKMQDLVNQVMEQALAEKCPTCTECALVAGMMKKD